MKGNNRDNRRGEISSPIILILLTVAAIAVAGIAVVWMSTVSTNAASQASLAVVGTPTISGNTIYATIKNLGSSETITFSNCTIKDDTSTKYVTTSITATQSGQIYSLTIPFSSLSVTANKAYPCSLLTSAGTIQFSALNPG